MAMQQITHMRFEVLTVMLLKNQVSGTRCCINWWVLHNIL